MHTANNCQVRSRRKTDKGAILMVVLIVMIALLGLGMTGLFLTSGSIQMNTNINQRNQALVVAEAGVERARGILNNQTPGWVPPVPTMLLGSTSSVDEVPNKPADCQGAARGAILVDQITTGCTATPTPAGCTLQNVPYPSLDRTAGLPGSAGRVARTTMGTYTVFIRQDQADCRMGNYTCEYAPVGTGGIDGGAGGGGGGGGASGVTTCTVPSTIPAPNGALVIRSEGVASDGKTRVVLEVTMTPSQGAAKANNTPMSALCAAGANGCDDNSSVQNGIVVNSNITQQAPPSFGGATSVGGAPGTGGAGGAGGTVTIPVTGPTGGSPSTGGATGTGGAGTGGATGTGGSTSCPENSCMTVATMGITGVWDTQWSNSANGGMGTPLKTGNTFFGAWLATHASKCTVGNIDITPGHDVITAALLSKYKIIVVLDICHTQAAKDGWIANKGANGGVPEYWCDQRFLLQSEANAVVDWVNNGGRMMTTIGVHNHGYQDGNSGHFGIAEATNVNMFLTKFLQPSGVTYSTNFDRITLNPDEVRVLATTDVTGFTSSMTPIPTAILHGPAGNVTRLMVSWATRVKGWNGSAESALPPDSTSFSRYASQSGSDLGVAFVVNRHGTHPGKVVVWGDEWITYDDVWSSNGQNNNFYQASSYWENVFTWFSTGCTP
jgi:hypothetical protein